MIDENIPESSYEMPNGGSGLEKKKTTKTEAVIYTICIVGAMLLIGMIMIAVFGNENRIMSNLGTVSAGILAVILFRASTGERVDIREKLRGYDFSVPVMIFLLNWSMCSLISHFYGLIASNFTHTTPNVNHGTWFSALLIAPAFEELMFRQGSQGICKRTGSKWFSLIFPTIAFTLCHGFYNIQGIVNVLAGTVAFTLCFHFTDNVLYTIPAHFLHNLFVSLDISGYSFFGIPACREVNGFALFNLPYLILQTGIFVLSVFWVIKYFLPVYSHDDHKMQFATK